MLVVVLVLVGGLRSAEFAKVAVLMAGLCAAALVAGLRAATAVLVGGL